MALANEILQWIAIVGVFLFCLGWWLMWKEVGPSVLALDKHLQPDADRPEEGP